MEFPHLGQHCSESTCKRLDFLPMKCDSCNKVFCSSHFNYERHSCPVAHKSHQVPMCPLCGDLVPMAPGDNPDLIVGRHIDQQCKSDSKKIFTNSCSYKNCKRKELVRITCSQCKQNFCLKHRHTADHKCGTVSKEAKPPAQASAANATYRSLHKPTTLFNANIKTNTPQRPATTQIQTIQGNMSEDEALARALALSIIELDETADRNRRIEAASTATQRNSTVPVGGAQQANGKDKCSLS